MSPLRTRVAAPTCAVATIVAGGSVTTGSPQARSSDPDTIDSDSINGRVVWLQVAQQRHR